MSRLIIRVNAYWPAGRMHVGFNAHKDTYPQDIMGSIFQSWRLELASRNNGWFGSNLGRYFYVAVSRL